MRLQSMTYFVLQGIDEVDHRDSRLGTIERYAMFLEMELKPEHFDPENPECLFVGFTVTKEIEPENEVNHLIVECEDKSPSFYLGWDMDNEIQFDPFQDDISVPTIERLIVFCDNYGYADIELTDYALSQFL